MGWWQVTVNALVLAVHDSKDKIQYFIRIVDRTERTFMVRLDAVQTNRMYGAATKEVREKRCCRCHTPDINR